MVLESIAVDGAKSAINIVLSKAWDKILLMRGFRSDLNKLEERLQMMEALLVDLGEKQLQIKNVELGWFDEVKKAAYMADDLLDEILYEHLRRKQEIKERYYKKDRLRARYFFFMCMSNPLGFQWRMAHKVREVMALIDDVFNEATRYGIQPINVGQAALNDGGNNGFQQSLESGEGTSTASMLQQCRESKKRMASIDALFAETRNYGFRAIELVQPASNYGGNNGFQQSLESLQQSLESGEGTSTASMLQQCRESVDTRPLIGRDRDVADLVEALCNGSNDVEDLRFIAVVGLPGIGKTKLARRTYDSEAVDKSFAKKIWICVSDDFDIRKILCQMVEQLAASNTELTSTEALTNKLQKEMEGNKYLLVLDDVWNQSPSLWQSLKSCLLRIGGSSGSMVLITARSNDVAKSAKASSVHQLVELSPDSSWALFEQTAFNDEKCPSNLETIGKQIVDKCKGVPLAITTLGATLQSNRSPHYWESIANSELWMMQAFEDIAPYLLLTFQNLPSLEVKQCFAYCSIYEKDAIIIKEDLISLWMAQGFLCPYGRSTMKMEEIGEIYFKILLSHSFLQVEEKDEVWHYTTCKMHDLVHDLARFVCRRDWQICSAGGGMHERSLQTNVSHSVIGSDMTNEVSTPSFMKFIKSSRLCTIVSSVRLPRYLLTQARYLRVLRLRRLGLTEVPNEVEELKHLRYFDVSYNPIKELPESITTLYHLQTLNLVGCPQLDKLPKGLSRLINLKHVFAEHFVEVPTGIERLACLQTLPPIQLSASGGTSGLSELGCLPDVKGSVRISGLEHVKSKEEAQKAGFGRKTGISYLTLRWCSLEGVGGSGVIEEEVLDGLQPHPKIRSLVVDGFSGDSFPSWIRRMTVVSGNNGPSTSLDYIVVLKFQDCRRCERMPALGKLPHLKTLLIKQMTAVSEIGTEFYTYDDGNDVQPCSSTSRLFPALKTLEITECPELDAWLPPKTMDPSKVAFPCLEELKIINCPYLTITPTDFPSLRRLELKQIRSADPLRNILNTNGNNNDSRSTLTSLIVEEIRELTNLPQGLSHRLTSLETLEIIRCYKLDCLPDDLGRLISLKTLKICGFGRTKLKTFPEIGGLCSLIVLVISNCGELEEIPSGLDRCTSLQMLAIVGCRNMGLTRRLEEENTRGGGEVTDYWTGDWLGRLPHLRAYAVGGLKRIFQCPNMGMKRRLEEENTRGGGEVTDYWTGEWLGRLPHLRYYAIGGNGIGLREEEQPDRFVPDITPLLALRSLRHLTLYGWPKLKSLPDQLGRFTRLEVLKIYNFDGMEEIPEFIGGLPSLFQLLIGGCSILKSFPSRGAMQSLNSLWIWSCPLLTGGCRKDDGPEWHKISHIKLISIDDEVIQDLL